MYHNEEHKEKVENRGDGYIYIGSYHCGEITIDGKYSKNLSYIRVKCPYCGKEYDVRLGGFVGKHKCKCTNCCNFYENSFAYYIQQELQEPLNKYWDWEKNTVNPYLINKYYKEKVVIKCDKKDYHGSYFITPAHFTEEARCPYCSSKKVHPEDSFGQYLINTYGEDAVEKYWSSKNTLNPFKISKNNARDIWILCQEKDYHNDYGGYKTIPSKFYNGNRCSYCSNHKVHPKDSFGSLYPEKAKYWSKTNKKSHYEVAPYSNKKYKFICEKCGEEFERSLLNLNKVDTGVVCKECNSSQLEIKTKDILEKYNINYNIQVEYNGLIGLKGGNLSYDFYLPDYNLLIECQGIQHEKWQEGWQTKEKFERQLEHDRRKKEYAKEHNINLLEIWYYDIDNIEEILLETLQIKNN